VGSPVVELDGTRHWTAGEARAALASAPEISLQTLCGAGPVLVVAPHPDDESLGCGGLVALAAAAGLDVAVAVLTDGAGSHPNSRNWPAARLADLRRSELDEAAERLGDGRIRVEAFAAPDGGLDRNEPAAGAWLARRPERPAAVFVTWSADPHPDHKAAARIAAGAAAGWGAALYAYPVWGLILPEAADAGPRAPALRLDVSAVLERKRAAVAAHRSQATDLIHDDPEGFRLRPEDIDRHLGPYEAFLQLRTRN
jgi:LmbE family N-acetylglucosaminyl deacetylase